MPTYTFYYSPTTHTVNGFTGYRLQTTQYTGNETFNFGEVSAPVYFRYSVFLRRPNGIEVTLGQNVAGGEIISTGAYTTTFTPAQTTFVQNSAIRVQLTIFNISVTGVINFITSQLAEDGLSSTQWTFRTYFIVEAGKWGANVSLFFKESWISNVNLYAVGGLFQETLLTSKTAITKSGVAAFAAKQKQFSFGTLIYTPPDYMTNGWAAKLLINNTSQNPVEVFISIPYNNLSTIVNKPGFLDRHGVKIGEVPPGQTRIISESKYIYQHVINKWENDAWLDESVRFIFRCGSQVEIFNPNFVPQRFFSGLTEAIKPIQYLRKSDTYKFNMMLEGCCYINVANGLEFDEDENYKPIIRQKYVPPAGGGYGRTGGVFGFVGWDTDTQPTAAFTVKTALPTGVDFGFFPWHSNSSYYRIDRNPSWRNASLTLTFNKSDNSLYVNGVKAPQSPYYSYLPKMALIPFNISGWMIPSGATATYTFNQVEQSGFTKSHILLVGDWMWYFLATYDANKFDIIPEREAGYPYRIYLKPEYSSGNIYTTAIKYENERPVGVDLYFTQYVSGSKVRIQYVTPAPNFEPIPDTLIPGNSQGFELTINGNVVSHDINWQGVYTEPIAVKITLFDSGNHIAFLIFKPAEILITCDEYSGFGAFAKNPFVGFGGFTLKEKSSSTGFGAYALRGGTAEIGAGGYAAREGSSSIGTGAFAAGTQMSVVGAGAFATKTKTANVSSGAFATKTKTVEIGTGAFATRLSISTIGTGAHAAKALSSQVGSGAYSARQRTFSVGTGAFATKRLSSQIGLGAYAMRGEETPKKKIIISKLEAKPVFISKLKAGEVV